MSSLPQSQINSTPVKKFVIALSCSPSKGRNSDSMLDAFITGITEFSNEKTMVEVEKIYLSDIPFDDYSYEVKDGPLPHEIKFKELFEKLERADGLVIATPTYNFSVPAKLKNFIDRIRPLALDFKSSNSLGQPVGKLGYLRTYFLVSGGTPNWAHAFTFFAFPAFWMRGVFLYFGAKCMGTLYSGDVNTFKNEKVLLKCKKKGGKYASQLMKSSGQGILERIFFRPPEQEF